MRLRWEKQNPTYKVLQAIADLHGIKLSKLFLMAEKKYEKRKNPAILKNYREAFCFPAILFFDLKLVLLGLFRFV